MSKKLYVDAAIRLTVNIYNDNPIEKQVESLIENMSSKFKSQTPNIQITRSHVEGYEVIYVKELNGGAMAENSKASGEVEREEKNVKRKRGRPRKSENDLSGC